MCRSQYKSFVFLSLLVVVLIPLMLVACSSKSIPTPTPAAPVGPGPSWTPQEAIGKIDKMPFTVNEVAWNASFNGNFGRWEVTQVRRVRILFPAREERRTWRWYVYEATGEVEGPFKQS